MPDGGMQKMSAALLAAVAEDPTLLEPVRGWYRRQYENASKSPRGTDIAGIVLFAGNKNDDRGKVGESAGAQRHFCDLHSEVFL
jgi:hypothetical protein